MANYLQPLESSGLPEPVSEPATCLHASSPPMQAALDEKRPTDNLVPTCDSTPLWHYPDLALTTLANHGLTAGDLARLELACTTFRRPAHFLASEGLSLAELAAYWACHLANSLFGQLGASERQALRLTCGGSWKLVLRHLEFLRASTRPGQPQVAAGATFSLAVPTNGEVLSWGSSRDGVLGLGPSAAANQAVPRGVTALQGHRVAQCSAGYRHALAVTDTGRVFAFGRDEFGCCGTGAVEWQTLESPREVEGLQGIRVVQSAAGRRFSALLSLQGDVFTFGEGPLLGHGSLEPEVVPRRVEGLSQKYATVVQIAASADYVLAVSLNKKGTKVYSFGRGWSGALGHGSHADEPIPREIEALSEASVHPIQIATGFSHAVALSRSGRVYTWGHGCGGCLGTGTQQSQSVPQQVTALDGLVDPVGIAAGVHCTFVIGREGQLYSFGWGGSRVLGTYPRLGLGEETKIDASSANELAPTRVASIRQGEKVVQVSAAPFLQGDYKSKHMLATTNKGCIYGFGFGHFGQLGVAVPPTLWIPNGVLVHDPCAG